MSNLSFLSSWVEWRPCGYTIPTSLMADYSTIMEIPSGRSYYCLCGDDHLVGEAILHIMGIGGWHETHTLYKANGRVETDER